MLRLINVTYFRTWYGKDQNVMYVLGLFSRILRIPDITLYPWISIKVSTTVVVVIWKMKIFYILKFGPHMFMRGLGG